MPDFVESAKNFVSSAVSRTSWEAQKQMRVRSKQHEIDDLSEQREQLLNSLVKVAIDLYQQGMLADPQLSRICASIMELDGDVGNRKTQLQELKKEPYPANQLAPGTTADYTPPPVESPASSGSGTTSKGKAKGKYQPPPPAPAPAASPPRPAASARAQQAGAIVACPTCGNPVRPNALYCRSCGTKLR